MRLPPDVDVSRETLDRLEAFHALLLRWNQRINLVSRRDEADLWTRHIADSLQLSRFLPPDARHLADFGSGAGFPGLILAAAARDSHPDLRVTLIESDSRKATFLSEAARRMGLAPDIRTARHEALASLSADVITARALAPLPDLLEICARHGSGGGMALFPKGETVHKELDAAALVWRFDHSLHRSVTDPKAAIVEVRNLYRVGS